MGYNNLSSKITLWQRQTLKDLDKADDRTVPSTDILMTMTCAEGEKQFGFRIRTPTGIFLAMTCSAGASRTGSFSEGEECE
jgi:hypothetical protein